MPSLTDILEPIMENPTFIFVDGSYYCFYRYYAIIQWWKTTHSDDLSTLDNPIDCLELVDKFRKTFVDNLLQMKKKLKINKEVNPIMIVGKDCKRETIWRNDLLKEYKANRENAKVSPGVFIKLAYEEKLFEKGGVKAVLKCPKLEADDCIAISVNYLIEKYPQCTIYIITSDRDYLQLVKPNVHIFSLTYKPLRSTGDPKRDLLLKIIMGDTSDNIPAIFPKCGEKTALKCIDDPTMFKKKITDSEESCKNYGLNKTLVDFRCIPEELVEEFMVLNIRK
jgi:5'-3' exonuclease